MSSRRFCDDFGKPSNFNLLYKSSILYKNLREARLIVIYFISFNDIIFQAEAPGPLPGDPDFKPPRTITPSPNKMKPRRGKKF